MGNKKMGRPPKPENNRWLPAILIPIALFQKLRKIVIEKDTTISEFVRKLLKKELKD